jgi:hypothetical protein
MRKSFTAATIAAAILLGSTAANAVVVVTAPTPAVYTPPATGGFIGIVSPGAGATLASSTTGFNDTFSFSILGTPGITNAQVGSILLDSVQNITFSSIMLDGNPFTLTSPPGAAEQWSCCGPDGQTGVLLGVGSHSINLIGTLTGQYAASYAGTINIQTVAVPEPATWWMMIIGLGGMGFALRRRRRPAAIKFA